MKERTGNYLWSSFEYKHPVITHVDRNAILTMLTPNQYGDKNTWEKAQEKLHLLKLSNPDIHTFMYTGRTTSLLQHLLLGIPTPKAATQRTQKGDMPVLAYP